jgi:hypothetical protein
MESQESLIEESRLIHKDTNRRYINIFMRELRDGIVKERLSKSDKR